MSTVTPDNFLGDVGGPDIAWTKVPGAPVALGTRFVKIGPGPDGLEVALAVASPEKGAPKVDEVRRLWNLRWNRRASPVVLVVAHRVGDTWKATVCGTSDDPPVIPDLDLSQVERICVAALAAPDPANAERTLHRLLIGQKDELVAGLTNVGLFASYELRTGVPARPDWANARDKAVPLLTARGSDLFSGLGYTLTPHGSTAMILTANGTNRAVAVLLNDHEMFDRPIIRFGASSPIQLGLSIAQAQGLPWLLVTRGTQLRLYPTNPDVGVGRKGPAETFTEVDLALLAESDAAYLSLLFSADALTGDGSVIEILNASADHAAGLGARLRERVYEDVVPKLAVAVANQMGAVTEGDLTEAYHRTLIILFRLLFVSYAEDRGLLPYQRNPRYTKKALKTLAREFVDDPDLVFDPKATDRWKDLLAVWKAVDDGNKEWGVPAYNGGLFASDSRHPSGGAIAAMSLTNREIGDALRALLIDTGDDGTTGPVDFRSLSVREFGTIYEGLLESSLSIAPSDLIVDTKTKAYVPAAAGDEVEIPAGQVYFHNASGVRKSTGSYFTKKFAVEHLLDSALEPALSVHLVKVQGLLERGDNAQAADTFFDFRVADLAMGSGHFLVAAIDRIESRFSAFLTTHPIPDVTAELTRLAEAARTALGEGNSDLEIEPSALLRRQIARRCVYGLDINLMAVELARLGIWIHTFVPGLPMSALDHGLVVGNSLTGIGTVEEVLAILEPGRLGGNNVSLFAAEIDTALLVAKDRLLRVARTSEATKAEVHQAALAHTQAMEDAAGVKALLDTALGVRLGLISMPAGVVEAIRAADDPSLQTSIAELSPAHMPYLFPEVFMGAKVGFDVILGNPPWEKVMWQPAPFWVGVSPGLMGIKADKDREARIAELRESHPIEAAEERRQKATRTVQQDLFKKAYRLRGGTHLELAQLMLERALSLLAEKGHMGLVLPRQSMVLAGWKNLRTRLVTTADLDIVQGRNQGEWIFDNVHSSYAVVLLTVAPKQRGTVIVRVARSPKEIRDLGPGNTVTLTLNDLETLTETNVIPWFNTPADRAVFDIMRELPQLASGEGWITGTHDARWDFRGSGPDRQLAATAPTQEAFKILMTRHVNAYAFDTTHKFQQYLIDLPAAVAKNRGLERRDGKYILTERHPLVIVRHPSRSDDSRTLIAHALPEAGIVHNKGYIHAVAHAQGTGEPELLALLGLFNTLAADWWTRRFVDRHITAPVLNQIPLPAWSSHQIAVVAALAGTLLARHGGTILAGGITVRDAFPELSELNLLVEIERLALTGYGLNQDHLLLISEDFNSTGIPDELADALQLPRRPKKGTAKSGNEQ